MIIQCSDITWDTEGEDIPSLPQKTTLEVSDDFDIELDAAEALSDKYGFSVLAVKTKVLTPTIVKWKHFEIRFTDADIVDIDDVETEDDSPYRYRQNNKMFLFHDHGFTIAVVMASNLQDALDAVVDADKLDRYLIDPSDASDRNDYMTTDVSKMASGYDADCPEYVEEDGTKWWWENDPTFLGNASEPFDIESVEYITFPLPKLSITALYGEYVDGTGGTDWR